MQCVRKGLNRLGLIEEKNHVAHEENRVREGRCDGADQEGEIFPLARAEHQAEDPCGADTHENTHGHTEHKGVEHTELQKCEAERRSSAHALVKGGDTEDSSGHGACEGSEQDGCDRNRDR